ncbi:hypothetical protein FRB94_010820 [Tulasnella sp. JGI-2019a]|nr:hypothetical protein FRB94_010820 [Tulasnella sp. JGI-2019a]
MGSWIRAQVQLVIQNITYDSIVKQLNVKESKKSASHDGVKLPPTYLKGRVWTEVTHQEALCQKEAAQAAAVKKKAAASKSRLHLAELRKEHKVWKLVATVAHKEQLAIDLASWEEAVAVHKASTKRGKGKALKKPLTCLQLVIPEHLLSPESSDHEEVDLGDIGSEELEVDSE